MVVLNYRMLMLMYIPMDIKRFHSYSNFNPVINAYMMAIYDFMPESMGR